MVRGTDTSETGLQKLIIKKLVEEQGYIQTKSNDFDKEFCINKKQLMDFIRISQPESYDFIIKKGERKFFSRLDEKIKKDGVIEVLRKGVKHLDRTIDIFYQEANSSHNSKDKFKYDSNIFSVTEELVYTGTNSNEIDLVIFINGIPIITMELKNAYTYQSVKDAINQYINNRDKKDKIFNFARCLVHFAVDTEQIYMTTKIDGKKTFFMPFNKGLNEGSPYPPFGAGNPVNPSGARTDYLWNEILTKSSLSNIIGKYVQLVREKDEKTKKEKKPKLIFPRYHQLMVVRALLKDAKKNGVGKRYLIQHSAGSGKSNSITWLTHQLVELFDDTNVNPLFDSVVVVTDRTVLDKQIKNNIKAFAQVKNMVEPITGSAKDIKELNPFETSFSKTTHMRAALENNKRVIICTVQTFTYVLKAVSNMPLKKVAFIIDEAHSSQNGMSAASMNALFSEEEIPQLKADEEGNINKEDLLNYLIESKKMLNNASYFAFTATPKNKTLETFGMKQPDGSFVAFHTYSMKQAIEEEFILDVLKNYTTYKSYYKLKLEEGVSQSKEYEIKEANKKMKNFVEGHEIAISEKARIMIDHFNKNVKQLINGKAKAMVVTKSIESAIKYKDAFDDYLKEIKSPYKAIVAFSGKKNHYKTGEELTEVKMNNFEDGNNNIEEQFEKDEYKFLIVADKFQTGFDQPLLHTMYVDKQLSDVQAVQTLSRLNRAYKPYKKDTFVLDFYNDVDDIKLAFAPYYTTTILSEETDINKLNDLQDDLDRVQVYDEIDIEEFFTLYYSNTDRDLLEPIIDRAVDIFDELPEKEDKVKFKSNAKTFIRTYGYLVKILDFNNKEWEMLWIYLKHLVTKLKIEDDEVEENILEDIDMDSYRVNSIGTTDIKLDEEASTINPIPVSAGGGLSEKQYDTIDHIISDFNKRFGNIDWGEGVDPQEAENILMKQIPESMKKDIDMVDAINNSDEENAKDISDEAVTDIMRRFMFTHTQIYKKFSNDENFSKEYRNYIFDNIYKK
ncbi:type I restriction endonuclease subunit R [Paraclostridium sordellii]|uniref:type I restriction endonuclease subunit R n=1 Tax=Paraclostridium sordellii TaxID=1505 RepID=UPI0005E2E51D|nr:type I restriction endonuclease [Paeniclostridium sordellii]CEN93007.1 helicase [[Clostridium] sordellii] [Paeniclostridium sordellii]CEN95921.1 helicase [[Clostridium] sordellii] [Paeniclostridium sordellii]